VLLLTVAAFTAYDLDTYRRNLTSSLSASAAIIADRSLAAVALKDEKDAGASLASLRADHRIAAAALYDGQGRLFVWYPPQAAASAFPSAPGQGGDRFENGRLILFKPLTENGVRLGTLYLQSDPHLLYMRMQAYSGIALLVLLGSVLVALVISSALQRRITRPILALAEAAKAVSQRGDYSIRAEKVSEDEIGSLTDAFNGMLARIEEQTETLHQTEGMRPFLAAIVDSSDDAIIGKDMASNVVSWNAGAERMFGYTAAEMLGQLITRLQSPDRPEEEARILEEVKRGGIRHYETVRICKDGQPVDVSLTVSPIKNAQGEIIGISSIARDITQRRQAEREVRENRARLSGVIESAMDAIISIDAGQRITIFNKAAEKMFHCPTREALGQPLDRFIPARFREAHREHVAGFGRTGATSREMGHLQPLSGLRADGEEFPIEASISHTEVGGQQMYTVILRDITERKRAEEPIFLAREIVKL
jgi:PAS domain S-box-containing protein